MYEDTRIIKIGTVVRLKGQNIEMTVVDICDTWATCQWYDTRNRLQSTAFLLEVLIFWD